MSALTDKLNDLLYAAKEKLKAEPRLWGAVGLVAGFVLGKVL